MGENIDWGNPFGALPDPENSGGEFLTSLQNQLDWLTRQIRKISALNEMLLLRSPLVIPFLKSQFPASFS